MANGERIMAIGGALAGLGGTLGVSYFIYSLESNAHFWTWPGWLAIVGLGLGILLLIAGLASGGEAAPTQDQRSGSGSTNYQAGRDINVGRREDVDR